MSSVRNKHKRLPSRAAALAVACGVFVGTLAPAAYARSASAEQEATAGGVEDIVVTARRRSERLQDIPVSISAVTNEEIQRRDISSLEKLAASTPQFTVARASNGSGAQLSLRGIGSSFTSIGIEQSVATVVDGVYYGQGRIINEGLFDLDRIEMLKGPQALFYGKNSTAGVISIATADPGKDREVIARAGYEFRARQVLGEAIVSGPLSETLGLRVAVRGSGMQRGYVENVAGTIDAGLFDIATGTARTVNAAPAIRFGPKEREFLARATLKWQPTNEFTATIKGSINRTRNDNPSWNYIIYDCPAGTPVPAGAPCSRSFRNAQNGLPAEMAASFPLAKKGGRLANDYSSQGLTATLNYELPGATVTSVTNYNDNRNVFVIDGDYYSSPASNIWTTEDDKFRAFSSELRVLTTNDGPINLLDRKSVV